MSQSATSQSDGLRESVPAEANQPIRDRDLSQQPLELLTQTQICRRLGICVQTWRNWRQWGWAPQPIAAKGRPRWRVEDIERFKQGRVVASGRRTFFGSAVRRRG